MISHIDTISGIKAHIDEVCQFIINFFQKVNHFFSPKVSILKKVYGFINSIVAFVFEGLSFILRTTSQILLFLAEKIIAANQYVLRKIYVWRILSIRKRWYTNKHGAFYNPRLKATISPCWEVTWNMSRPNGEFRGINSKEEAQELAFKLWMKKRLIHKRLDIREIEVKVPLKISQKILPNKIHLRKATPMDVCFLLSFLDSCGHPHDEKMKDRLDAYAYGTYNHIVIAERGKKIVGFIAFVIHDLFLSEGKRCHIEELILEEDPVDFTLKRKLLEAVEEFARENNSKTIDMTTGQKAANDHSQDLYRFLGYQNDHAKGKAYFQKEL